MQHLIFSPRLRLSLITCISGVMMLFGLSHHLQAQEPKIEVAQVNGEIIYLDEVMQIAEQLPADIRQQPINTYFDRLVDDIIDARLAAAAGNAAGLTENPEILA